MDGTVAMSEIQSPLLLFSASAEVLYRGLKSDSLP